ncbi:MAG: ribonuclease HII [Candidatus Omnitrophica bacterium]|nr:ribonuclease HII [Candidatus Omnitrophota bacterium]
MKKRSNTLKATRLLHHEKSLNNSGYSAIAGVDEAGRGPLAGPVVAGAVILKDLKFKARIDDSKKLSARQREEAYLEIVKKSFIGVGIVDEKTIDRINIYQATKRAMRLAISKLEIPPDYVIVDGNMKIATKCPLKCIVGGDSKSLSIAAASIIAKVTRDRIMLELDKVYPQYGFARHKGYGTKLHMEALNNHGPSPIHRLSFNPVKKQKSYI